MWCAARSSAAAIEFWSCTFPLYGALADQRPTTTLSWAHVQDVPFDGVCVFGFVFSALVSGFVVFFFCLVLVLSSICFPHWATCFALWGGRRRPCDSDETKMKANARVLTMFSIFFFISLHSFVVFFFHLNSLLNFGWRKNIRRWNGFTTSNNNATAYMCCWALESRRGCDATISVTWKTVRILASSSAGVQCACACMRAGIASRHLWCILSLSLSLYLSHSNKYLYFFSFFFHSICHVCSLCASSVWFSFPQLSSTLNTVIVRHAFVFWTDVWLSVACCLLLLLMTPVHCHSHICMKHGPAAAVERIRIPSRGIQIFFNDARYDTDGHMLRLQLRKCHRQDNSIVVHMMRARMLI